MATTQQIPASPIDRLPEEILEHIAVVGGMPTILELLPVNKRFHTICSDTVILHKLASYQVENQKWWKALLLRIQPTWTNLAKCLLADHKSISLTNLWLDGPVAIMTTHDILQWLPEMIMSRHKVNAFEPESKEHVAMVTCPAEQTDFITEEVNRIAFLESFLSGKSMGAATQTMQLEDFYHKEFVVLYRRELDMTDHLVPYRSFWNEIDGQCGKKQLFACLVARMLRVQLDSAIESGRIAKLAQQPVLIRPMSSINYLSQAGIYGNDIVPFTQSDTPIFERHLPVMTNNEFIKSGTWVGYYNVPSNFGPPGWDAMMNDIKFTVPGDYIDHCVIHGRGIDGIGEFTISGTVEKATGRALLQKQYLHQHMSWSWSAYMTPYGLVGTWGGNRWGGWFWLWKKDFSKAKPFNLRLDNYTV